MEGSCGANTQISEAGDTAWLVLVFLMRLNEIVSDDAVKT